MDRSDQKVVKTGPKAFSPAEICRIIKVAKKQGVASMQIGDFSVSFHEPLHKGSERKSNLPNVVTVPLTASKPVAATEREFGVQDKRTLDELRAAQLLIDDPLSYEEAEIDAALHGHEKMVTVNEDERHW